MLAKVGGVVFGGIGLVVLYCVAVVADVVVATSIAISGDEPRLGPM